MKPENKLCHSIFAIALGLCFPHVALAIDCNKAQAAWEIQVCKNNKLKKLDQELNSEYKDCLDKRPYIKEYQKEWLKDVADVKSENLEIVYVDRVDQLKLCTGKINLSYSNEAYANSDKPLAKNHVRYYWKVVKLRNKTIIRYPQIVNSKNKNSINSINNKIENEAKDLLLTSLNTGVADYEGRFGISYDNYDFQILSTRANVFGYALIDPTSGCLSGCVYHPTDTEEIGRFCWNLKTGDESLHGCDD